MINCRKGKSRSINIEAILLLVIVERERVAEVDEEVQGLRTRSQKPTLLHVERGKVEVELELKGCSTAHRKGKS